MRFLVIMEHDDDQQNLREMFTEEVGKRIMILDKDGIGTDETFIVTSVTDTLRNDQEGDVVTVQFWFRGKPERNWAGRKGSGS